MDPEQLAQQHRASLADSLAAENYIRTESVRRAFRTVPRHKLLPQVDVRDAYANRAVTLKTAGVGDALPPGRILSSATMPSLLATVLEETLPLPGMRILQIGTGPGYLAALLQELVGDAGHVVTLELDPTVSESARRNLSDCGYIHIHCVAGDGCLGCPSRAPYDRIFATASCAEIPVAWIRQLDSDGTLVLPLSLSQRASYYPMLAMAKHGSGLRGKVIPGLGRVGFLPLYGLHVGHPVLFEPRISELEAAVDRHLGTAARSGLESEGLRLLALLEIAKRVAADWHNRDTWDPVNIASDILAQWQEAGRSPTSAFEFGLVPYGDKPAHYRWHYPKGNQDLYVDLTVE